MANYEQLLHLIRYKNWHTEALFDRKFKLVCSELNGRYVSNDFKVEVRYLLAMAAQVSSTRPSLNETQADTMSSLLSFPVGERDPHG